MKKLILLLVIFSFFSCQPNSKDKKQITYESNSIFNNDMFIKTESIVLPTEERITKYPEDFPGLITTLFSFGKLINAFDSNGNFKDSISSRETYFLILRSKNISKINPPIIDLKLENNVVFSLDVLNTEKVKNPKSIESIFLFKLNNEQINILQKNKILSVKYNYSLTEEFYYTALNQSSVDNTVITTDDFSQFLKGLILFPVTYISSVKPKIPFIPYPHSNSQRTFFQDNYKKMIDSLTNPPKP